MRDLNQLFDEPRLRPVIPMLYVAWADGELSEEEMSSICDTADPWLEDEQSDALDAWLDPDDPPTPTELMELLGRLREESSNFEEIDRKDLVGLGIDLARADAEAQDLEWLGPQVQKALGDLQDALGYVGADGLAEVSAEKQHPLDAPPEEDAPSFDVARLTEILDGRFGGQKRKVRQALVDEGWHYHYDEPKEKLRARTTDRVQKVADLGFGAVAFPGVTSDGSLGEFIATFESLANFDLSLVIKYGVQFGLWGGSIYFLGTEKHHEKYLSDVASMKLPGCFAMSETGHGSNVRDCETTATYDHDTRELVIHTPNDLARKEWIGNAARDGQMATVFAQLNVGEHGYGVHAFIVPIRDDEGNVLEGVRIDDCGHKAGLNGVDNGRIWFDNVRIPLDNLLDRYASIDEDGEYQSPITSSGKRFFTMLGTLVGGRVAVGAAGVQASKSALTIATRYATRRRQFGPKKGPEVPIMEYLSHQRRLLPRIAKAYALTFAYQQLVDEFLDQLEAEDKRELEAHTAGLKAYATWFANDTIQECREACGGQGYLTVNRFADLRGDADIFATFEGDNTVLMQLVSKARLTDFRNQFSEPGLFGVVRFIARQAETAVTELNPYVTRQTDAEHLRSADFQRGAMMYRDGQLTQTLARRFRRRLDDGKRPFDALNECQDHFLSLAHAHIECEVYDAFARAVEEIDDPDIRARLDQLRALFGLSAIHDDMGWYMENGYIESAKARAIRTEINVLCGELKDQARHLVDAFGIPDELVAAPIALGEMSG